MPKTCFCPGCKTGYLSDNKLRKKEGKKMLSMFSAPKDPAMFEMWQKAIPRADRTLSPTDLICILHFKPEDIDAYFETKLFNGNIHRFHKAKPRLKPGVVPSIFPNVPGHSTFVGHEPTEVYKKRAKRKKVSNLPSHDKTKKAKISWPDNKSSKNDSSHQTEKENVLMEVIVVHPIPEKPSNSLSSFLKEIQTIEKNTNPSLSDSQKNVMPDAELQASPCLPHSSAAIAENHSTLNFCDKILAESSSIENQTNNYFTTLAESVVAPAKNYSRRNNTTSTIAESVENDSDESVCDITSIQTLTCNATSVEDPNPNNDGGILHESIFSRLSEKNVDHNNGDKMQTEYIGIPMAPVHEDFVTFEFLKANTSMFETTNSWWKVNTFDDFIVFGRWTSNYTVERRIVITKDLAVKVFLLDKETTIGCDLKKLTIGDLTKLIFRVENLKICSDIDKKDRNCSGFLQSVFMCKRYTLCLNCIKWRKDEKKKNIERLKESANCIELLNFNLVA